MAATSNSREIAVKAARLIAEHKGEETVLLELDRNIHYRGFLHYYNRKQLRTHGGSRAGADVILP